MINCQLYSPANVTGRIDSVFAVGLGLAVCYACAAGETLFAMEREAETYEFLRQLPVTPLAVFAGKVVFAVPARRPFISWHGRWR